MTIKALGIFTGQQSAGVLFQYALTEVHGRAEMTRLSSTQCERSAVDNSTIPFLTSFFITNSLITFGHLVCGWFWMIRRKFALHVPVILSPIRPCVDGQLWSTSTACGFSAVFCEVSQQRMLHTCALADGLLGFEGRYRKRDTRLFFFDRRPRVRDDLDLEMVEQSLVIGMLDQWDADRIRLQTERSKIATVPPRLYWRLR